MNDKTANDNEALRKEYEETFDLRWQADMRACRMWQMQTGKRLTLPDHADLVVWLLQLLDDAASALEPHAAFAETAERFVSDRAKNGGSTQMPVTEHFRLAHFTNAAKILAKIRAVSAP